MSTAAKSARPSWKREFFAVFGSMKTAIVLLLFLAVAMSIGTVLPQDQGPGLIHNSTFHPLLKQVLLLIQAYDVYHAAWFNALLALLFLNIAVCTYLRFPATWRRYAQEIPRTPAFGQLQEVVALEGAPSEARLDLLRKRGYRVHALEGGTLFAEKDKFVRLGPTFIHISLFLIIFGGIWGGLTGIKNSQPVQVGQTLSSEQIYRTSYIKGVFSREPKPFDLRLDGFRMDYHPNGVVKQYYSRVTVLPKDGGQPYQRTMWVNEPLIHDGVYLYQSFWGIGGLTAQLDGQATRMALTQANKVAGYITAPFEVGAKRYVLFVRDLNEPAMVVSVATFQPVAQLVPGASVTLDGHRFGLKEYHLFSGLEIKQDPGIPMVYLGCGILLFGLAMVPFCHREVWLKEEDGQWLMGGRTHKGRVMLRKEMSQIAERWGLAAGAPRTEVGVHAHDAA